ncbi:MAG: flagellar biosynthetic protein FliQ [Candidatus Pelethousia sp.]|nr:flagellar biosynthetic protein FliQ [Candidatus Pelethousia sp.]
MSQSMVITVLQDAIMVVLKCSMPMMAAALLIGVVVSIFQAATQISEQTLAFVPKIIGVFLAILVCAGYILSETSGLVTRLYGYIGQMIY